ncbi:MAG TPA: ABC transporter substrate-binding protein [Acidimicrobiales bacterium]|nr:ABC transporter substrate-binding protein [Acidimicrobiales bacterium]
MARGSEHGRPGRLSAEQARRLGLAAVSSILVLALVAVSVEAGQRRLERDRGARSASHTLTVSGEGQPAIGSTATTVAGGASTTGTAGSGQMLSGTGALSSGQAAAVSSGAAGTPHTYDPGVTDTSILVGGSTFLSGPAAVYGDQLATGLQAGLDAINAEGGVNGRKFQLVLYDDGADPAKQLANTKRLVEVDHVFALTMIYAPGQLGQYVSSVGIPVFTEGQFDEEFTNPWWFATGGPQRLGSIAIAEKAAQLGAKKAAIFYLNAGGGNYTDAYAQAVSADFQSLGISVAFTESVNPTQSDCTDGMTKAAGDGVDFIDFELDVGHTIPCVLSAQEENYKPAKGWGGYLIGVPATPQGIGAYSAGMYAVDAFGPVYQDPTYLKYVHQVNSQVEAVSSPTAGMYTAAFLMASGIQKLGNDITRQRLRDVINTFTDWTPPFLNPSDSQEPRYTFRPGCHVGLGSFYYIQVKQNPSNSGDYEFYPSSPYMPFYVTQPASSNPMYTCRKSEP